MKDVALKSVLRSKVVVVLGASAVAVGILGGLASASGEQEIIHGCINKGSGALRVVADPGQCSAAETAISWNKEGVPGPAGPAGPAGADAQLEAGSVSTAILRDASNDSIAPTGVTTSKIENRAVTPDKLAGRIPGSYIESIRGEQVTGHIAAWQVMGPLDNATISAGSITGDIAASQVTGALDNATISAGSITGDIAASQVTGALANATISAGSITGAIEGGPGGSIKDGTIAADDLQKDGNGVLGAVSRSTIQEAAVDSSKLEDGAVTFSDLNYRVLEKFYGLDSQVLYLDGRISNLASPDTGTDTVHTQKLAGANVVPAPTPGQPLTIPAGQRVEVHLPISHIQVGDFLAVSPPVLDNPLLFAGATITADGEVTAWVYNPGAGDVSLGGYWIVNWMDLT